MAKMHEVCHIVTSEQDLTRLDSFLADLGAYESRSAASKAIKDGKVLVDGELRSKSYAVRAGESVFCTIDEEVENSPLIGENIPLDIRFEDEYMGIISKQPRLICHPSDDHKDKTLVNALIYKYGTSGLCNVQGENDRPGIVHRLDGDTSGLMMFAKDDECGQALMDAIALKQVDRRYIALVHGIIQPETGMIDAPIERNRADRKTMAVGDGSSSREAITTFKVLKRYSGTPGNNGYTLVECKLFTGRTHQIRVHMQYIGHPIVGDVQYNAKGPKSPSAQLGLSRQFLHSYKLSLDHPITGNRIEIEDDIPSDLQAAINNIDARSLE